MRVVVVFWSAALGLLTLSQSGWIPSPDTSSAASPPFDWHVALNNPEAWMWGPQDAVASAQPSIEPLVLQDLGGTPKMAPIIITLSDDKPLAIEPALPPELCAAGNIDVDPTRLDSIVLSDRSPSNDVAENASSISADDQFVPAPKANAEPIIFVSEPPQTLQISAAGSGGELLMLGNASYSFEHVRSRSVFGSSRIEDAGTMTKPADLLFDTATINFSKGFVLPTTDQPDLLSGGGFPAAMDGATHDSASSIKVDIDADAGSANTFAAVGGADLSQALRLDASFNRPTLMLPPRAFKLLSAASSDRSGLASQDDADDARLEGTTQMSLHTFVPEPVALWAMTGFVAVLQRRRL